jgi:putative FmdB family regulatory protein
MPIYEYVCGRCQKKTEVIQSMNDAPLKVCLHCGGRLKKAFSAPAIQFKGSGWYITDYARAKQESGRGAKSDSEGGETAAEKQDKAEKSGKSGPTEKPAKSEKSAGKTDKKKA